jgi:co-chaperonin GroES (HSP10)
MGEARIKRESLTLVSPFDGSELRSGPRLSHPVTRDGSPIPFFPIGDRVLVERIPPDAKIGILHIPDNAQAPQQYATICAAGPRAQAVLDDAGISIGDTICFGKWAGVFFEWQVPGTESYKDRRRVDLINVGDIYGGKELAEKMIDGRLGIDLYQPKDAEGNLVGDPEYRFFKEIAKGNE